MPAVTAMLPQVGVRGVLLLYLDGSFAFSIRQQTVRDAGVFIGARLNDDEVDGLRRRDALAGALQTAYKFLSYRPRTEAEVRERLRKSRVPAAAADDVVHRLKEHRFLDDAAFAQQWSENRTVQRPRGRKLVQWELKQKGIAPELAEAVAGALDDTATAYRAGARRAQRLTAGDYPTFRKRLGDFLLRRGFSYDVSARTVERLWNERPSTAEAGSDGALDDQH
ncbi:MAG: hypothetical protein EXR51_11505 [Dehalococcoidia bacterium]|nr:hypothetical protein [Dehalococcoidia bacterium]